MDGYSKAFLTIFIAIFLFGFGQFIVSGFTYIPSHETLAWVQFIGLISVAFIWALEEHGGKG